MSYKRSLAAVVILGLCLSGCSVINTRPMPDLYDVLPGTIVAETETKPETVGVYFDVTPSMAGFLTKQNNEEDNTLYSLCLHELGKLVAGQYGQVSCFRVDTPLWQVEGDENVFEEARKKEYYRDSSSLGRSYIKIGDESGYSSRCLTAALDYGTNQDLFVFITDFYENSIFNNVNAETVLSKFNELAGRDDGKVFGLIGIRSAFSGTIYDVGVDGASVKYGTGTEENVTRPFYMIIRGYPNQVRDFCEKMTKRLNTIGARKGEDYEATVFYVDGFSGLDYLSLKECENRLSPRKDFIWPYTTVTIRAETGESTVQKNVYGYRKSGASKDSGDRILYFSYTVDEEHREAFHALIAESTEKGVVEFLPEEEQELSVLPCTTRKRSTALWDGDMAFVTQTASLENAGEYFEVLCIYYDEMREVLYAVLRLKDSRFDKGIWRLQWASVLDDPAEADTWWEDWTSPSGADVDYSKTERLTEYVETIAEKMPHADRTVLNGVVYLEIEEEKR